MKYHVIYKEGKEEPFYGTQWQEVPWSINDPEELLKYREDRNVLTWRLNDLPLTEKFIEAYKKIATHSSQFSAYGGDKVAQDERPPGYPWTYRDIWWEYKLRLDIYKSNTIEDFLASRVKMNELIDYMGLDLNLKLNTRDIYDARLQNLNALHECFENGLQAGYDAVGRGEMTAKHFEHFQHNWEAINYIVHMNEKCQGFGEESLERIQEKIMDDFVYCTTLAPHYIPAGDHINEYKNWKLTPEDYEHFTLQRNGQELLLDYGTTGKDLYISSVTNDIELAKGNKTSQQIHYNPWVMYEFHTQDHNQALNQYEKWISKNNIANNIDLSLPEYTPGRHVLSEELISHRHIKDPITFYNEIVKRTPVIEGFIITDENNKSIL